MSKHKNEKKLCDLIKEQEKLILQLELEISKLRVKNEEVLGENQGLKDEQEKNKKQNNGNVNFGSTNQLRIISQLKAEVDKHRMQLKIKSGELRDIRHDLDLETQRREAAEENLERSAARFAGERHRLLVKLRNEQMNVTRRMLDYGDDFDY